MSEILAGNRNERPELFAAEVGDIIRGAFGAVFTVTCIDEDGDVWVEERQ